MMRILRTAHRLMRGIVLCSALHAQTLQTAFPVTNGNVYAIASAGTTVFLGGSFTYVSSNIGNGAAMHASTGTPVSGFPAVSGEIISSCPDGSGGLYIGGSFTLVNGAIKNYLARINSDGSVHAWNPDVNGTVRAIAVSPDLLTVYIAGSFSQVNSTDRSQLAALSAVDGSLTSWNPGLSGGSIFALLLSNSGTIYVGGSFNVNNGNVIGTASRNRIAEISLSTGVATSWNPNVSSSFSEVNTIAQTGSSLFIGGSFTQMGGSTTRNNLAKIAKSNGAIDGTWNPNADFTVNAIVLTGNALIVGGQYFSIGGANRSRLAVIDTTTGTAVSGWAPEPNGAVRYLLISGQTLYVGGEFTEFNGSVRTRLASVDIASFASVSLNGLDYGFGSTVNTLSLAGTTLYAGGAFTASGGKSRNGLAAVNGLTGEILNWDPNPSSASIQSLLLSNDGNSLYVGGSFSSIGGQSRNNLAKVSVSTGLADASWDPDVNGGVEKMSLSSGDTLFFYGYSFTTVNGSTNRSSGLAAVQATGNGTVTAFNPDGVVPVTTRYIQVSPDGSTVYLGYNSNATWSGETRNYFAALNTSDGAVTGMDPVFNHGVFCSAIVGNAIYFGGQFTDVNGNTDIQKIAKFDASGGWSNPSLVTTWNNTSATTPDGDIRAIVYTNSGAEPLLYLGGGFQNIGPAAREHYAAVKVSDASVQSWNISASATGAIDTRMHVSINTKKIYIADAMTSILGTTRSYIAAVDGGTDPLPVELLSFSAVPQHTDIHVQWSTASETNNYGFSVERRSNDHWMHTGFVGGSGTTNAPQAYAFMDRAVPAGRYSYRLKQIDRDGTFKYSGEVEVNISSVPAIFSLHQNYPNPFNPATTIEFTLPATARATVKVYNMVGQEVATVFDGIADAGTYHTVQFDASRLASGVYLARLQSGSSVQVRKMVLMK